jgi:small conductance mechanosensitive channel
MRFDGYLLGELSTQEEFLEEIAQNPGVIRTYLEGAVPSLLGFLVQLVIAVLVLLVGSRIIKMLLRIVKRSLEKGRAETGVITFLCSLLKYTLYFLLVMIILGQFGVTTSSVVAVLGSAGLTLGLAMQGSLSNFAGGVLILLLKPFVVGDYIIDNGIGQEGTVSEITIFYTKLLTVDNRLVMIPNGTLSNSSITNTSHMEKRRVDLMVGVSYEANLSHVKEVLTQVATQDAAVLPGEPMDIFVSELGESAVQMGVRVWVKNEDYWPARWRLTEQIKNALDENHIPIPYPQLDVTIYDKER